MKFLLQMFITNKKGFFFLPFLMFSLILNIGVSLLSLSFLQTKKSITSYSTHLSHFYQAYSGINYAKVNINNLPVISNLSKNYLYNLTSSFLNTPMISNDLYLAKTTNHIFSIVNSQDGKIILQASYHIDEDSDTVTILSIEKMK